MARRRRTNKLAVSLFPFLSVLACVIGTLTLMITALALGQMDTDEVATLDRFETAQLKLRRLRESIQRLEREIAELEKTADQDRRRLADLRVELQQLLEEKQLLLDRSDEPPEVDLEIPVVDTKAHKRRTAEMADELSRLEQRRKQLSDELAKRGGPRREATVVIQPSGSGVDLEPVFVECTAEGIVIHDKEKTSRVRRADLKTDPTYLALLKRVAERPKARVIFLIRDDGLATYSAASAVATGHYARHGKLPVVGHGKIDLGLFQTR
ncbi:MAG TPA: hypothetical protein EYH34_19195 [Planctomycetes bacterium]|nr:hypothetical protein [Planctomycetota bacterium]